MCPSPRSHLDVLDANGLGDGALAQEAQGPACLWGFGIKMQHPLLRARIGAFPYCLHMNAETEEVRAQHLRHAVASGGIAAGGSAVASISLRFKVRA